MKKIFVFSFVFLMGAGSVFAVPALSDVRRDLKEIQKKMKSGSEELTRLSSMRDSYLRELQMGQETFRAQFTKVTAPLLIWPSRPQWPLKGKFVEHERSSLIITEVQQRLLTASIKLLNTRRQSLQEVETLTRELKTSLKDLESKQARLKLQAEELKQLSRSGK